MLPAIACTLLLAVVTLGSVDPATLSEDGHFTPLFGASIDFEGKHRAEARHAWEAVKANG